MMEATTTTNTTSSSTVRSLDRKGAHKRAGQSRHWCMYHGKRHVYEGWGAWNKIERKWDGIYLDTGRRYYKNIRVLQEKRYKETIDKVGQWRRFGEGESV